MLLLGYRTCICGEPKATIYAICLIISGTSEDALWGGHMGREWIGLLCSVVALTACTERLSKEEAELLNAMVFVWTGIEDNTRDGVSTPWRREVRGRSIEFSRVACLWVEGCTRIGFSDEETNRIIRKSSYIRYVQRISLTGPCTFKMEDEDKYSKGDSQQDFSSYETHGLPYTYNLANAVKFEVSFDLGVGHVYLQGPAVACYDVNACENDQEKMFDAPMDFDRPDRKSLPVLRRERAVEFIKKSCPGKAF
jgi:hypothetical protein